MNPFYNIIVYTVWFLSTYFVVLMSLLMFVHKDKLIEKKKSLSTFPKISIIAPAYNEEKKIAQTIASLKKIAYPYIEFILVNDGSKDATSSIVKQKIRGDKRFIFIDRKENIGKAASLNEGIAIAKGEFIACMDADSVIEKNIFYKTIPYFDSPTVGAVTVSVELKSPKTFLHKIIDIEYTIGLSLFLKLFSFFNCVFVTPGPFSIYRKSLLTKIGGFDKNNITEDHEIAFRIHKSGYSIANCFEAKVRTISPETFKGLYIQRRRWYSGAIQTLLHHKDVLFNNKLGYFGYFTPFNYFLLLSGMSLFYAATYLSISKIVKTIWQYQYTGFNFFEHLFEFNFDILRTSQVSLVGTFAFLCTLFIMFSGLYLTKKKMSQKKIGMIGFPFLFFLYQIYWTGALIAALRRKTVKWR